MRDTHTVPISLPDGWSLWWPLERGSLERWLVRREGERGCFEATLLPRNDAWDELRWDEELNLLADRCLRAQHPALPRVRARYTLDAYRVVLVERLVGLDLDALYGRLRGARATLHHAEAARMVASVADAVATLWRDVGYAHGALDTAAMRLTIDGRAALLDPWRLIASGHANVTGRTAYAPRFECMSPEVIAGQARDSRADVYSLGMMLYEAVTGARAYTANGGYEILRRILDPAPIAPPRTLAPSLPPAFDALIQRAVAKRRDDRHASIAEFADALAPWAEAFEATSRDLPKRLFDRYATRVERTLARTDGDLSSRDGAARRSLWRELRDDLRAAILREPTAAEVIALTALRDEADDDLRALRASLPAGAHVPPLLTRLLTGEFAVPAPPRRVRLGAVEVETCPRTWASLRPQRDRDDVRHCDACDEPVRRVDLATLTLSAGRSCMSVRRSE
jgi:Protein tyrosine and serine/threonine kinase